MKSMPCNLGVLDLAVMHFCTSVSKANLELTYHTRHDLM
jgi:hypothetical protein